MGSAVGRADPRAALASGHLVPLPLCAVLKGIGLVVTDDLFRLGVPFQRPAQPHGDIGQMAGRKVAMVAINVRDRRRAVSTCRR